MTFAERSILPTITHLMCYRDAVVSKDGTSVEAASRFSGIRLDISNELTGQNLQHHLAGVGGRPDLNIKAWCRDPTGRRARDGTEGGVSVIVILNCGMDVDPEMFINCWNI